MSRLGEAFAALHAEGRAALIPYLTAGDPYPEATVPLMRALVDAGADALELGVPFSDPMADGPVIQRASERALRHGVTLTAVLDMVRLFRQHCPTVPVVLMGYLNPFEVMGYAAFARRAADAGPAERGGVGKLKLHWWILIGMAVGAAAGSALHLLHEETYDWPTPDTPEWVQAAIAANPGTWITRLCRAKHQLPETYRSIAYCGSAAHLPTAASAGALPTSNVRSCPVLSKLAELTIYTSPVANAI